MSSGFEGRADTLGAAHPPSRGSMEVAVYPETPSCGEVADIQKAELCAAGSLLGCLRAGGRLAVWDPSNKDTPPAAAEGCFVDFWWDEVTHGASRLRLLAVGSQWNLQLLEVEAKLPASISLLCMSECAADSLLSGVGKQNLGPSELQSLQVLSFKAARCCVLLNGLWLLQMDLAENQPQLLSCCSVQPTDGEPPAAVHHCVCADTLFSLCSSGLISVHSISDGSLLASINLPAYLSFVAAEGDSSFLPSSLCLLQVSSDLSTAVAVSHSNTAVALDLNHYFRMYPEHLLCAPPPCSAPLRPKEPVDQDSLQCSSCSRAALRLPFSMDRSWETRLTSAYSRARQAAAPSSSSSTHQPAAASWSMSLPHLKSHLALSSPHSRAPPGGSLVSFSVPESFTPSTLSVSEFSALLTFTDATSRQVTVALWDLESRNVSYHAAEGESAPLQLCGQRQHRLLLKKEGVFQVWLSVSQQELLNKLMLFGSAATVDAVCHLNTWGRCSIPIHSLQAGLKNRQLDTVDFYLKSKENLLKPAEELHAADAPAEPSPGLTDSIQELCTALDLLCSAVKDSSCDAQSRQFSEQLLNITMSFIHTQIRSILSSSPQQHWSASSCVQILDPYVTQLRTYMKKYPWWGSSSTSWSSAGPVQVQAEPDQWEQLSTEEIVTQSILTNQIPRAQALLRKRGRPEHHLSALRMEGLRQVFSRLQHRDLQTATTLLVNMGVSVKKQLHSICLYTNDRNLRDLLVEELSKQGSFSEEELKSVEFIRQVEKLCSQPPVRCPSTGSSLRLSLMRREMDGEELVRDLVQRQTSEEVGELLRLDWVRNWNQSCQTAVLLSRLQHRELSSCDSSVLWHYLTALHDQNRLVEWIEDKQPTGPSHWPEITAELVNQHTACSTYLKENILDLLARRGMFVPGELADVEQLFWRLAQATGLMAPCLPVSQYRSPQGLDLHGVVITFCLDCDLQYLLYSYLEHYRLTPRNCRLLSEKSLSESQPWCEMLVKIQEITRDLSDPELLFQASLTCAQVLLSSSQASLSSLLLEGHSLLVLAAVMFSPGGIDQVMAQGERAPRLDRTIDPQLLKMALAPHPRLRAALFPSGVSAGGASSDISIYHLLQSLHPLDPCRLFGWQTANTLNSTEASELPHFSSPHLVSRFALVEKLDFLYYIHRGRPSFAFGNFLLHHLSLCGDVRLLLQRAWTPVYRLALQCFHTPSVTSAAVCFCELLGISSIKLRVDVKAMNTILQHWNQSSSHSTTQNTQTLVSAALKLVEAEPGAAEELIGHLEAAIEHSLEQRDIHRSSYEAAQEWALAVHFCQLHSLKLSTLYPVHCAQDGHFIHFLLFVQLHNFPLQQVRSLLCEFGPTLQAHLTLAFQDLQVCGEQPKSLRLEEDGVNPEHPRELSLILLQSQQEPAPHRYLLQEALLQHCPLLAMLAVCLQAADHMSCLCVWLLTSVDQVTAGEATSHLIEAPQYHEWTLHDLSVIWKVLLGRGHVRPLLRGFELFQKDCPLLLVLQMFELCCDCRKFTEAKSKLLDFQRTLITLRSGGPAPSGAPPLQWVESQASALLLIMLQRCSSQYDLHRLLQLLTDVDKLLKSHGPDFRKLSQLSQLLQGSGVALSPSLLQCTSPSLQQEELQNIVDALQARGQYSLGRQVALLAGLPVHSLLIHQLLQEVNSQRTKPQWGRLETRVIFWRKCQQQLQADGTDPGSASRFFQSQTKSDEESRTELLDVQERCMLLQLQAHWLTLLSPVPVEDLQDLEKQLWLSRVHEHLLSASMEEESVFKLPPPAASPDVGSYRVFLKEFSFSTIAELNQEDRLSLDRLPAPSEELSVEPELSLQESGALSSLVDQMLDEGSVHEAARVCAYFSLKHADTRVLLRCHGLASGALSPDPGDEPPGAPTGGGLSTSASLSSLSSLMMLPLPEDAVTVQLQRLVEDCRHGNNYCKRVLNLYQLSKDLQCSFTHICKEDPSSVLQKLLLLDQPERFRKAQAFIKAQALPADSVAQLVSSAVLQALLQSGQDLSPAAERQVFRLSEGRDSLMQLIKLCEEPSLVGLKLLENLNAVPLRDLSCIVELLIIAHDCFSLTCNMEGIVRVLQTARHLSHSYLAPGEHYSLLVRLLTGMGRYNEMTYIFDLLHQNHRFEMLLRKKVDTDRGQSCSLKTALLDYIKRCLPADSEKHNMVALCFSMRREIGENHEMAARTQLKMIESQEWVVTPDLKNSLLKVLGLLKDAAESYFKDSCVRQATRCVRTAKLVTLQLHFLNQGSELRLINLQPSELLKAVMNLPRCYQVFVVAEAYGYSPDWAEVLFRKVILNGEFAYLEELKQHCPLTPTLFEDIFKKLDTSSSTTTKNAKRLLTYCDDVYIRYKLAYQMGFYDDTKKLLEDAKTSSYLNDRLGS
ncbi:spatacsin isoform X1 [Oryzias melastigma]|uniref:spatacsin isoform X1 n=1 Tax=Oryzias melastigma TaxID=30732 RepID=UPI000CF80DE2|nr:spatacsin isoform X1 [Oryzias melastigma]